MDEMIEEFTERPFNGMLGHNRIDGLWKARLFEGVDQKKDTLLRNIVKKDDPFPGFQTIFTMDIRVDDLPQG